MARAGGRGQDEITEAVQTLAPGYTPKIEKPRTWRADWCIVRLRCMHTQQLAARRQP